jgi:hypothetical protein
VNTEFTNAGGPPLFFAETDMLLVDGRDWAVLTRLVAED